MDGIASKQASTALNGRQNSSETLKATPRPLKAASTKKCKKGRRGDFRKSGISGNAFETLNPNPSRAQELQI